MDGCMASDKPPRRALPPRYTKSMRAADLLVPRPEGLYCPPGDFHIDPTRPVARALVTHAHSDHATAGHGAVLATRETLDIMAIRLGDGFAAAHRGRRPRRAASRIGGVTATFHPAGHVLGSAQIAVERAGLRIVAAGDYKRTPDPTCAAFEPVPCDVFITEATFGLPVFRHPAAARRDRRLLASLAQFPERTHLVGVYALGKAQRLIRLLRDAGHDAPDLPPRRPPPPLRLLRRPRHRPRRPRRRHPRPRPRARLRRPPSSSARPPPSRAPGSAASPTR